VGHPLRRKTIQTKKVGAIVIKTFVVLGAAAMAQDATYVKMAPMEQ
jgi:hypothetical protein